MKNFEKSRIYVEGLLSGSMTIDDVAKLSGLNRDTIRKAWCNELLGGYTVAKLNLQDIRDEDNATRKTIRDNTRRIRDIEWLGELLRDEGVKRYPLIERPEYQYGEENDDVIAVLSDLHIGQEYSNYVDSYNIEIASNRLGVFCDKLLDCTFEGDIIHLFVLGDLIENIHLHKSTALEVRMDNVEQLKRVTDMLGGLIYRIIDNYRSVKLYIVGGNHDRLYEKDKVLRDERFSDIVSYILEREFAHFPEVTFVQNLEPTIAQAYIGGHYTVGVHGDLNDSQIDRYLKEKPEIILKGHNHKFKIEEDYDCFTLQNGALCGSGSDYCVKGRLNARPEQTILKVNESGVVDIIPVFFNRESEMIR